MGSQGWNPVKMNRVRPIDWIPRCLPEIILVIIFLHPVLTRSETLLHRDSIGETPDSRSVVEVKGEPNGVAWVVQLSDLHFSVHHPERAKAFTRIVGPALALIKPSLVLITGDLTDGKSSDLLTMKQDEREWMEYDKVVMDVITVSGLPREVFYDLRGNHDNFGVPVLGGKYDFFQKYSISSKLNRSSKVQSVTLQNNGWKHLFVGIDSTMDVGVRGPTNVFGHPTDQLLSDIETHLSQWDGETTDSVTKIAFGHFPISFSASTESKKTLKDVFLNHSLSAYLCGHLHTKFGKNLKRHHQQTGLLGDYFQLNGQQETPEGLGYVDCSDKAVQSKDFWEWEMGDWRKSRNMRVLAIDQSHISFVDVDYTFESQKTIVLPTFPLDSRSMQRNSMAHDFYCESTKHLHYGTIRALVFSHFKIVVVIVKIYDSRSEDLSLILEANMQKVTHMKARGALYAAPWNWKAFEDPSPDRYWLQVQTIDEFGTSILSEPRPFSINGRAARLGWKLREIFVMGCTWEALYYPLFCSISMVLLSLLVIPRAFLAFKKDYTFHVFKQTFGSRSVWKNIVIGVQWIFVELARITSLWISILVYVVYLTYFPWIFHGNVFSESDGSGYMSRDGWTVNMPGNHRKESYIGVPDVMVIVIPHFCYVLLPTVLVSASLAAEKVVHRAHYLSLYGKKNEDNESDGRVDPVNDHLEHSISRAHSGSSGNQTGFCGFFCCACGRWIRKLLFAACCIILWWHLKYCGVIIKAYDSNPFMHAPVYCWSVPLLLAFAFYRTSGAFSF